MLNLFFSFWFVLFDLCQPGGLEHAVPSWKVLEIPGDCENSVSLYRLFENTNCPSFLNSHHRQDKPFISV